MRSIRRKTKERLLYGGLFVLLVGIEVLIALFVHDRFVRPYIGDVLVMGVMYCFVRIFVPTGVKLLPLYLFCFAAAVEVAQYFDYVRLLGLSDSRFFRILLGTSFAWCDMLCYAAGSLLCVAGECLLRRKTRKGKPV